MHSRRRSARLVLAALVVASAPLGAQGLEVRDSALARGFELEGQSRPREAAEAYRRALATRTLVPAILGLERVYAELGWADSLATLLDSLIAAHPSESMLRDVQLRSLLMAGRDAAAHRAFRGWVAIAPGDPRPYRQYSELLLQMGRTAEADSVVRAAEQSFGPIPEFALPLAKVHASRGEWIAAASAWRVALVESPFLDQAALFSLMPAGAGERAAVRRALAAPPADVGPRRALALLELHWGNARAGWEALASLRPDSAVLAAWHDYAERVSLSDAPLVARDAYTALWATRRRADDALRAAGAALDGGDAAAALRLATDAGAALDSATAAAVALPVRVRALAALSRPADAERLVAAYARHLDPAARSRLARAAAWGWVRTGDIARARAALDSTAGDDQPAEAGWLALYEGNLAEARRALRRGADGSATSIGALSLLARTRADRGPTVGGAYLSLVRGDTAAAARGFERAAVELPDAASLLLLTAARLHASRDEARAIELWSSIVVRHASSPEAPEADLEWARALRRRGDSAGAVARLEHLILTYPGSALVPQARRELEGARDGIPRTS
jgi:hypothetical protein